MTAAEAAAAMAEGVRRALPGARVVVVPVADGGDGTLDVLLRAAGGPCRVERRWVTGPAGVPREARLGWLDGSTAVVELAEAAGLRLLPAGRLLPLTATSRGAGELIAAALDGGATRIVVGVGGSASTDGGAGILAALGLRALATGGAAVGPGGGGLGGLARVDASGLDGRLAGVRVDVAVDTAAVLHGPAGAAHLYAGQKGAGPDEVERLDAGLRRWAHILERDLGTPRSLRDLPGSGAAGGAAYGLAAVAGARLVGGAALVCDAAGLDAALAGADLVLTGEGRIDATTATGKAPHEVARRAATAGVRCVAIAGSLVGDPDPLFASVVLLTPAAGREATPEGAHAAVADAAAAAVSGAR